MARKSYLRVSSVSSSSSPSNEAGSSLFILLFAVALFAALSYAISQQGAGTSGLGEERVKLLASEVIDMGNGLNEAVSRLRIHKVTDTGLSFDNSSVAGYINATCSDDSCKIFSYDGGGRDWETPVPDINTSRDWGFTGDLSIKNIGGSNADLVAILPDIAQNICAKINVMLGVHDSSAAPPVIPAVPAGKFIGTYAVAPTLITSVETDGKKSACIKVTSATGSAVSGAPLTDKYMYYQVLSER